MLLLQKSIAEFFGTFIMVFAGCGAILVNQISGGAIGHPGIAAAFGLVVMTMIYAIGHLSGAHLNPAVTLAFAATRHFPPGQILPYIAAQFLGAAAASLLHRLTLGPVLAALDPGAVPNYGLTLPVDGNFATALVWEFLLTFLLMFVIMGVATDTRAIGKAAGIAVGAAVCLDALFGGPVCGASMNPARSFGPALVSGTWDHFAAYVVGPVSGALAGGGLYKFLGKEPPYSEV